MTQDLLNLFRSIAKLLSERLSRLEPESHLNESKAGEEVRGRQRALKGRAQRQFDSKALDVERGRQRYSFGSRVWSSELV